MAIFSAIVLFAMIWFVTLLVVLTIRQPSQGEAGKVVPGTHSGAPANPQIGKRVLITTGITVVLWVPLVWLIVSGTITLDDIDMYKRFGPNAGN